MCKHRSLAEVHVGPLPVCYEVPSTGNHRTEKIFICDCSAEFNRQVLHASISRPSSKWKKFFALSGGLNLIACFLSSLQWVFCIGHVLTVSFLKLCNSQKCLLCQSCWDLILNSSAVQVGIDPATRKKMGIQVLSGLTRDILNNRTH